MVQTVVPGGNVAGLAKFPAQAVTSSAVRGRGAITVSDKGIANGLSDIVNDGADFGVDTPQTQTSGIQEAVNYAIANNRSEIKLLDGIFYITAPFVENSTYSVQAQIYLPATANPTHLRITSVSPIQRGIPNGNISTTGAIIYSKPPS